MNSEEITSDSTIVLRPNVHARRFDDEIVVLDLEKGVYFGLDEVGAAMWEGLAAGRSVGEVARGLLERYQVSEAELLEDARALVRKLTEAGLAVIRFPRA